MFLVFIHGFMGNERSFHNMPAQLSADLHCPHEIYTYDTKGSFAQKTNDLVQYLRTLNRKDIYLICHSMGGVLGVDAGVQTGCVGVISIDTPFFGLNPQVINHGATKVKDAVSSTISQISNVRGGWGLLAAGLGAAVAFAATQQESAKMVQEHVKGHLEFLGPLWDVPNRNTRFEQLRGMLFCGFYASTSDSRFVEISVDGYEHYFAVVNYTGSDSIDTHMNMFG